MGKSPEKIPFKSGVRILSKGGMTLVAVTVVEPNPGELMDTDSEIVSPAASWAVELEDPVGRSPPRPPSGGALRAEEIPEVKSPAPGNSTEGRGAFRPAVIPETISPAPGILGDGRGAIRPAVMPEAISATPGILGEGSGAFRPAVIPETILPAPGMFKAGTLGDPNGGIGGVLRALVILDKIPGGLGCSGVLGEGAFRGFLSPETRDVEDVLNRLRAETPGTS